MGHKMNPTCMKEIQPFSWTTKPQIPSLSTIFIIKKKKEREAKVNEQVGHNNAYKTDKRNFMNQLLIHRKFVLEKQKMKQLG